MTKRLSIFLFIKWLNQRYSFKMQSKSSGGSATEKPGANQPVKYDFQRLGMDFKVRTDLSAINNELPRPISIRFEYGNCFQEARVEGSISCTIHFECRAAN
jgi:hypothetical protein